MFETSKTAFFDYTVVKAETGLYSNSEPERTGTAFRFRKFAIVAFRLWIIMFLFSILAICLLMNRHFSVF